MRVAPAPHDRRCAPSPHNAGMSASDSPRTLLLVDGSSYLYRAYHALPDLRSPDGFPTGALHGMVAMMQRLRDQYPSELAACVFDAKGPTFRDDWYPQYKAQRAPMPDALVEQIGPIHEVVRLLGWPVLEVPGVEADDVIGTLCRLGAEQGRSVVVSTGDKDLAQLVTPQVTLINTMSNERLDVAGVLAKFGVPPERIVDYLTLVGDAVDNIPGVAKVGPKTAAKWIDEHGSLDGVIAAAAGIKGVAGENLRAVLDWLPTARKLVTVRTDCELAEHLAGWPALDALALRPIDGPALLEFYARYGFKTLRRDLETRLRPAAPRRRPRCRPPPPPADPVERRFETVLTPEALEPWIDRISAAELTAIDTETDSLDAMQARLVGISLSVAPGAGGLHPDRPRLCGCARPARPVVRARAHAQVAGGSAGGQGRARTSSTTCMCSPTPASRCRATATTRCCRATCSRRTGRTAWKAWPTATSGARA